MQKYSKTMQMKQFSLAGIPLRTIIKSSQSGIAISNHEWDPRLGRCEEFRPGLGPAVPVLWGTQSPQNIHTACSGGPGRDREREWGPWRKDLEFTELPVNSEQALRSWDGTEGSKSPPPIISTPQRAPTPKLGSAGATGGAGSERGHERGSERST